MKVEIFVDKNLAKYLSSGWNEQLFLQGKISTLTGRTFQINNVTPQTTIKELKHLIETQESIEVEKQQLRKGKTILQDENQTLYDCWITDNTKLLLVIEGEVSDYRVQETEAEGVSTKLRKPVETTKTLVLNPDEEEAKKLENSEPWWKHGKGLSGPIYKSNSSSNANIKEKEEDTGTSPILSNSNVSKEELEEKRKKQLAAIQSRLKKKD